jgi:serine/threonine protein kinase
MPKGEYGLSGEGVDLLKLLLTANPKKRISAKKALSHVWFKGETVEREKMPKCDPLNEIDRVARKRLKQE